MARGPAARASERLDFSFADRADDETRGLLYFKAALEASVRYLASDLGPQKIRVNAISAGPVKTASARAIKDFSSILDVVAKRAPLRHHTEPAEVGDAAVFLASDLPMSFGRPRRSPRSCNG